MMMYSTVDCCAGLATRRITNPTRPATRERAQVARSPESGNYSKAFRDQGQIRDCPEIPGQLEPMHLFLTAYDNTAFYCYSHSH